MPLTTKDALLERMADATSALKDNITMLAPAGCVMAFAGNTTPDGWLLCDGSAVSRTTYAALFAVIGTTYGSGDGSTTFNVPDLVDKFIQGNATSGNIKTAGLPNLTGAFNVQIPRDASGTTSTAAFGSPSGVFYRTDVSAKLRYYTTAGTTTNEIENTLGFDASKSSSVYGGSDTVQPPALTLRYIIKY